MKQKGSTVVMEGAIEKTGRPAGRGHSDIVAIFLIALNWAQQTARLLDLPFLRLPAKVTHRSYHI